MAFGELYRFEYKDQPLGRLTTIKILQDGFAGSFSWVNAGGDPVIIEAQNDNDFIFNQIYGSSVTLVLRAETNFQFIGLFSANAFKNKVEIWKEPEPDEAQEIFWTGFILPDQYSEPIDFDTNYDVSITARDALGALKDIDFVQPSGNRYIGKQQVIKIIAEVLKKTQLDLNINFGIDLVEKYTPSGITNDPLENIFLDYAVFYQDKINDCEYVLKQILQSFGARIIQANGEWWIERVPMYITNQTLFKYDKDGKYLSEFIYNNTLTYTGKYDLTNNRLFFSDKKGNLEVNPAFKSFQINQDYGKKKTIFANSGFEENPYPGSSNWERKPITVIPGWKIYDSYNSFFNNISLEKKSDFTELDMYNCRFGQNNNNYATPGNYIISDQVLVTLGNSTKRLKLEFDISTYGAYMYFRVEVKFNGKWLRVGVNESATVFYNEVSYQDGYAPRSQRISMVFNTSGEQTGYLQIKFINDSDGYFSDVVWIDNIGSDFVDNQGYGFPENATFDAVIDPNNNKIPDTIESILGDLPGLTDKEDIYIGGYWYFNGTGFIPTSNWSVFASERELVLMTILSEGIYDQYRQPKHKVSGTLCGNFQFNKSIFIGMLQNKLYLPMRMSLSDKYCKCQLDMLELNPDTEAVGGVVWGTEDNDYVVSGVDILTKV